MKNLAGLAALAVTVVAAGVGLSAAPKTKTVVVDRPVGATTVYIRNLAPQFFSDAEIRRDIPAWTQAMNQDFSQYWNSPRYSFVFLGRKKAPTGAVVATFVKDGPVKGALAFHSVDRGVPSITVYSGTAAYYGYDNSVSFTHELQELSADPYVSGTNQGWPYDWIYLVKPDGIQRQPQAEGTVWAQEVSDPVEAYSYPRAGADGKPTQISDFVTPNWFNDGVNGPNDFMRLCPQPFTIMPGGYAQFFDGIQWQAVTNFRHVAADRGFFLAEKQEGVWAH